MLRHFCPGDRSMRHWYYEGQNGSFFHWLTALVLVTHHVAVYARSTLTTAEPRFPEFPDLIECGQNSPELAERWGRPTLQACRRAIAELPDPRDTRPWFWYNHIARMMRQVGGPVVNIPYRDCPVKYASDCKPVMFTLLLTLVRLDFIAPHSIHAYERGPFQVE